MQYLLPLLEPSTCIYDIMYKQNKEECERYRTVTKVEEGGGRGGFETALDFVSTRCRNTAQRCFDFLKHTHSFPSE
jgi:hypothetical protein